MQASGIIIHFTRCNAPAQIPAWEAHCRDELVPALAASEGIRAATFWALTQQPTPGMPSVGFSHAILFETTGDVDQAARDLEATEARLRAEGRIDVHHAIVGVDVLEAHGAFDAKPLPTAELTGHILAYVGCTVPEREAEWDEWNDAMHMPDMLECGGFRGVSRWRRRGAPTRGTRHLTLYDVGPGPIEEAVEKSAAIMPGLVAAGRKLDCHVGGLTVTLRRV